MSTIMPTYLVLTPHMFKQRREKALEVFVENTHEKHFDHQIYHYLLDTESQKIHRLSYKVLLFTVRHWCIYLNVYFTYRWQRLCLRIPHLYNYLYLVHYPSWVIVLSLAFYN